MSGACGMHGGEKCMVKTEGERTLGAKYESRPISVRNRKREGVLIV